MTTTLERRLWATCDTCVHAQVASVRRVAASADGAQGRASSALQSTDSKSREDADTEQTGGGQRCGRRRVKAPLGQTQLGGSDDERQRGGTQQTHAERLVRLIETEQEHGKPARHQQGQAERW